MRDATEVRGRDDDGGDGVCADYAGDSLVGKPAPATQKLDRQVGFFDCAIGVGVLVVLIFFPSWTLAAAMATAIRLAVANDFGANEKTGDVIDFLAYGVGFLFVELLNWFLQYQGEVPFRDVLFPTEDTPADLRMIFIGWLFLFAALISKIRAKLNEDFKWDNEL
ncbi:MAG: hypothetical protein JNN20_17085 [Betaproteobacteria bacterium]|nr:hypothetical protein [Betaproteobacteria bacterium]